METNFILWLKYSTWITFHCLSLSFSWFYLYLLHLMSNPSSGPKHVFLDRLVQHRQCAMTEFQTRILYNISVSNPTFDHYTMDATQFVLNERFMLESTCFSWPFSIILESCALYSLYWYLASTYMTVLMVWDITSRNMMLPYALTSRRQNLQFKKNKCRFSHQYGINCWHFLTCLVDFCWLHV